MTNNTDPVRALPDQWRDAAEFFKGDAGSDIRETLRACARDLEAALAQQPAAPSGEVVATDPVYRAGYAAGVADSRNNECACTRTVAVTAPQQPAGVDRARFRKAPCYLCGYNGPGYFQPETHPCAALYHAAQQQGGAE